MHCNCVMMYNNWFRLMGSWEKKKKKTVMWLNQEVLFCIQPSSITRTRAKCQTDTVFLQLGSHNAAIFIHIWIIIFSLGNWGRLMSRLLISFHAFQWPNAAPGQNHNAQWFTVFCQHWFWWSDTPSSYLRLEFRSRWVAPISPPPVPVWQEVWLKYITSGS